MRRISLALALVGAVAVTGCSGGAPSASKTETGVQKGVAGQFYFVNLFTPPVGGRIVATTPVAINCGASSLGTPVADLNGVLQYNPVYYAGGNVCGVSGQTAVQWVPITLSATPEDGNAFIGWAGDCSGTSTCTLTAGADKTVSAIFGPVGSGHGDFSSGIVHGNAVRAGVLSCRTCHGAGLTGQGNAPSCVACHSTATATMHKLLWSLTPADQAAHGAAFFGATLVCTSCHGADLASSNSASSCATCHGMPHVMTGGAYPTHGADYIAEFATAPAPVFPPAVAQAFPIYSTGYPAGSAVDSGCAGCHGGSALAGTTAPLTAPACTACHYLPPSPTALAAGSANHFDVSREPWALYSYSQACSRCHTSGGFQDYVGIDGSDNRGAKTFNMTKTGPASSAGGYSAGPLVCATCHNATTNPSRDVGNSVTGLTSVSFTSLITVTGVDKGRALCATCHQARSGTNMIAGQIASRAATAANMGLAPVSITVSTAAASTALVVNFKNINTPTTVPALLVPQTGYTAIFNGNVTPALNGQGCVVSGAVTLSTSTAAAAYSSFTCAAALPATPPTFDWVSCMVPSGTTTTCMTTAGGTTPVIAPNQGFAKTSDSAILYPTATGGSTTTLVDANRAWTVNQWAGWYVYFITGLNAGKYALISQNDGTTLTVAAQANTVANGNFYLVVNETRASADQVVAATTAAASPFSPPNPHYLGSGATEFGAEAAVWYQYPGKTYMGRAAHVNRTKTITLAGGVSAVVAAATCADCHDAHTLQVIDTSCVGCHSIDAAALAVYPRTWAPAGAKAQIAEYKAKLFEVMNVYSKVISSPTTTTGFVSVGGFFSTENFYASGTGICFDNLANPYWFIASSGDVTPDETGSCSDGAVSCCKTGQTYGAKVAAPAVPFATGSTPALYRAGYIYKFINVEPGAWAHNATYVGQILYDAITDLNAALPAGKKVAFTGTRP
jgi:hypothetical protein